MPPTTRNTLAVEMRIALEGPVRRQSEIQRRAWTGLRVHLEVNGILRVEYR